MVKSLLPVLLILWCPLIQAQIYKWVDEKGRIQYSELPPPNHAYEVLDRSSPPGQRTAAPQQSSSPTPAPEGERRTVSPGRNEEIQPVADADAVRARNCEQARINVKVLEESQHPVLIDAEGNETLLDEAQRQAAVLRNREYIETYCTP